MFILRQHYGCAYSCDLFTIFCSLFAYDLSQNLQNVSRKTLLKPPLCLGLFLKVVTYIFCIQGVDWLLLVLHNLTLPGQAQGSNALSYSGYDLSYSDNDHCPLRRRRTIRYYLRNVYYLGPRPVVEGNLAIR